MRKLWLVNAGTATFCAATVALTADLGHWWSVPLPAAAGGINVWLARRNYPRHEPHRPDYAKIGRLEIELGLVDPPKPPASYPPKPVNPTIYTGPALHPKQVQALMRKPDHPCSLCIPGRPSVRCPFNSVCQT